ncbi:hypothetical protein [Mesobacillus foraminis]|nr:hypothetical protein [Mesobacillus foraminis]
MAGIQKAGATKKAATPKPIWMNPDTHTRQAEYLIEIDSASRETGRP